jgi:hypothetical protein
LPQGREQLFRGDVHGSNEQHLGDLDALLGGADAVSFEKTADFIHGRSPGVRKSGLIIEAEAGPA